MPRSSTLLCDIDDDLRAQIEQAQHAANAAQAAVPDGYERFLLGAADTSAGEPPP